MRNLWELPDEAAFAELSGKDIPDMAAPGGVVEAREFPSVDVWQPPGPVAGAFFMCDDDVIAIRGPVGSGKTTAHLRSRIRRARMMPRSCIDGIRHYKVVLARHTLRALWSTTMPSWWAVMPKKMGTWAGGRGEPVTHTITFEDAHGPIRFTAEFMAFGESPGEIEANIRGVQTTDLALEEMDTNPVTVFTGGITRIDRYPGASHFAHLPRALQSYGQISGSYNAPDENNWVVRVMEGQNLDAETARVRDTLTEEGVKITFFRQPGYDEPGCENLQNLGPKYYPRAIAGMKAEGKGNDVERLVYNRIGFLRIGEPVFKAHFKRHVHVSPVPLAAIPGVPLRIGLDQGYFGAAVIGQFIRPFQWRILGELPNKDGSFASTFGANLRELLNTRWPGVRIFDPVFADLAGNSNESQEDVTWISQVQEALRLPIEPQRLGGNRVEPRLAVWRAAMDWDQFGNPGLLIDPGCTMLIRGLANDYIWDKDADKSDNAGRKPRKRGNRAADVVDAGGYMMLAESLPDGRPLTSEIAEQERDRHEAPAQDNWDSGGNGPKGYDFNPLEGF